jgi:hypothetical protein
MRKSRTKSGSRPLRAGIAVAATTAAVLAGTALPASAGTYVLGTTQVSVAGGTPLYFYSSGTLFDDTDAVRILPAAVTCPGTYATGEAQAVDVGLVKTNAASSASRAWITSPALAAGTYKTCYYTAVGGGTVVETTTDTFTAVVQGNLSALSGAANARITLTVPSAPFSATSYAAQFVAATPSVTTCPTTYTTASPPAYVAATTARTSTSVLTITVPSTLTVGAPYLVCAYAGTTAGSSALTARGTATFATNSTTLLTPNVSPAGGSSGTANNIVVSVPSTSSPYVGTPQALLSRNSCPSTRPTAANLITAAGLGAQVATTTTKISTYKLAVGVPTSVIVHGGDVTTPWNVCVYASSADGSVLLTNPGVYTVAPVLTVGASVRYEVGASGAQTSASGPAQGGSTITISGLTGIPSQAAVNAGATLNASLGGSPITITSVIDSTSFVGTTTAHAPGDVKLAVTTAAGKVEAATADYTYTYGISVTPNTATTNTTPVLDIFGAGFEALTFDPAQSTGTTGPAAGAQADTSYVLLTTNGWYAQDFVTGNIGNAWLTGAPMPMAFCNMVLPISDEEIICTLDLTQKIASVMTSTPTYGSEVPEGTYTITVVNDADDIDEGEYSVVSSGSTFTVASF